jgi:hypothetical protein
MLLRMLANVLPRQSVSFAISSSIRSDGFIGSLCLEFLSRFHASSFIEKGTNASPVRYLWQGTAMLAAIRRSVLLGRSVRHKSSNNVAFPHPQS